jgi:hypothetical protein
VLHLFGAGGHFGFRSAINQRGRLRAQPARRAHRVHGGIAAADDDHVAIAAVVDGLIEFGELVGAHQVGAREKLVGRVDAVQVLAGHAEKNGQARAGGHEDCVVAFHAHQFVERDALADDDVGLELHAHAAQVVDFFLHDCLGQTKLGNAVDEHAAQLVQRFKDAHAMALLDEIARGGKARRTAAHDGYAFAGGRSNGGQPKLPLCALEVGDEPLQVADGNGLTLLAHHATAFALALLRAHAAGDGGQRVVFAHLRWLRQENRLRR